MSTTAPGITTPQHFSGLLVEHNTGQIHGLHQSQLRLVDEDSGEHVVLVAHGRGADAERAAEQMRCDLQIGERYIGTATVCRSGAISTYWMGTVSALSLDRRQRTTRQQAAA